ncbi:uncharacterized protein LAJ45_03362 [Morchella importuna]|uniref:uncharacterized protein n=1 Tax=Morchella importuna TaxID=1174673 RepID=UPI001E8EE679|nr:uncharacterized protein LAJ45_03362 [Morchella importuna]KAH8152522.1 hypothetical protein LAJ45_03362 [Morchella importuna]
MEGERVEGQKVLNSWVQSWLGYWIQSQNYHLRSLNDRVCRTFRIHHQDPNKIFRLAVLAFPPWQIGWDDRGAVLDK